MSTVWPPFPPFFVCWRQDAYGLFRKTVARIDNPLEHVFVIPPGNTQCPGFNLTSSTAHGTASSSLSFIARKKKKKTLVLQLPTVFSLSMLAFLTLLQGIVSEISTLEEIWSRSPGFRTLDLGSQRFPPQFADIPSSEFELSPLSNRMESTLLGTSPRLR